MDLDGWIDWIVSFIHCSKQPQMVAFATNHSHIQGTPLPVKSPVRVDNFILQPLEQTGILANLDPCQEIKNMVMVLMLDIWKPGDRRVQGESKEEDLFMVFDKVPDEQCKDGKLRP